MLALFEWWFRTADWEAIKPIWPITLDDGTRVKIGQPIMRRYVDGKWQYRQPTADEMQDFLSGDGW
jgi:hypothetical protein